MRQAISRAVDADQLRRRIDLLSDHVQASCTPIPVSSPVRGCNDCSNYDCVGSATVSYRDRETGHDVGATIGPDCIIGYLVEHVLPYAMTGVGQRVYVDIGVSAGSA